VRKVLPAMKRFPMVHRSAGRALLCAALALAALLATASPSSAIETHLFDEEFTSVCPPGKTVGELAVDYAHEYLYVNCALGETAVIRRFDWEGNPVPFSASEPYLSGNEITENPVVGARPQLLSTEMAVDNSGGPNKGRLLMTGASAQLNGGQILGFEPSGELVVVKQFDLQQPEGLTVDPNGNIYGFRFAKVRKFSPFFQEIEVLPRAQSGRWGRVDSHEALWGKGEDNGIRKYETNAWTTRLHVGEAADPELAAEEIAEAGLSNPAATSPFAPDPLLTDFQAHFEIDPHTNDLLVVRGNHIDTYSEGTAEEPAHQVAPAFGSGSLSGSQWITMDDQGNVYASKEGGAIVKFKPGPIVPDVKTFPPNLDEVGHKSATLHGRIELDNGPAITGCRLVYGLTAGEELGEVGCSPDPAGSNFTEDTDVSAELPPTLSTGTTYHYDFEATNANGTNSGVDRTVTPAAVLKLRTLGADGINEHEATLHGSFDPDSIPTEYAFQYGLDTSYGNESPMTDAGSGSGVQAVATTLTGLPSGKTFHYRILARNELGATFGQDQTFRTASPPSVSGLRATEVRLGTATLNARINPVGYDTTYRFEYGPTLSYGQSAPLSDEDIGAGTTPVDVSQVVSGLAPGVTYHFKVVAQNEWGTTESPDTTVNFEPPACPNSHVRQMTRTSYLPDCRAYELVSPSDAGSVVMFPSDAVREVHFIFHYPEPIRPGTQAPLNTGRSTSPPRFSYFAGLGSVQDLEPPNLFFDTYVATRTPNGWETTFPGLKGSEAYHVDRASCSESFSVCIDHNDGATELGGPYQVSANLFDVSGNRLGTLPTNVGTVPGGEFETEETRGDERLSGDGSHYVLSSRSYVFAPGGTTEAPGSAYSNDIAAKTVKLISLTPSGEPIPQEIQAPGEYIQFPGMSSDGSHVLMSVAGAEGPLHLYMRVDEAVTYDVSQGAGVTLLGMTRDGTKVDFLATQRLSPADHDNSADVYQWDENGGSPTLTLLSQGDGNGDTDECAPVGFGSQCDAVQVKTEREHPYGVLSLPPQDSPIAEGDGDVFFFSPELLDPTDPGVPNQRNLYEYHNGKVELVATFDPGTRIRRMQISPDGVHAGFITESNLTDYDSHGDREMYTYDARTGTVLCASCRPDGEPPTSNVTASQSGPFMSDDGRVFFNTRDALVPQDVDGEILDVYEFVDGRPQLISSGTGSRDATEGAGELINLLGLPKPAHTGLESVSADGADVYFTTFDVLVPQDENGPFVKFYDARTGGGFEPAKEFAGCEAADECHNEGSNAPPAPVIGTEAQLGSSGGAPSVARKHRRRHKHARRHRRHKRHGRHRPGARRHA
jgi:hypothetical protein